VSRRITRQGSAVSRNLVCCGHDRTSLGPIVVGASHPDNRRIGQHKAAVPEQVFAMPKPEIEAAERNGIIDTQPI